MAWFLAMQGPAAKAVMYQLQESADIEKIAEEMRSAATLDRVVAIPALMQNQQQVTLYVRPAAWGMWTFYQLSEEERKALATAANPLIEALSQAARQQQGTRQQQGKRL